MPVGDAGARVGFLGLGLMGTPMALNLARAGIALVVWNRSPGRTDLLAAAGASVATDPAAVFEQAEIVLAMLTDVAAIDAVLGRGTPEFELRVAGHVFVHMGTIAPADSSALAADIAAAGGQYVEAPVSGSRVPAELGQLVSMVAGPGPAVKRVRPLLEAMSSRVVDCGPVPGALTTKLAVNLFLITVVAGLSEAVHFADRCGVDLATFAEVIGSGPLASDVSRVKLPKLIAGDFAPQAAVSDVLNNIALVADAPTEAGAAAPLTQICLDLYTRAVERGFGGLDMVAVLQVLQGG